MTELAELLKDDRLREHFERNHRSYEGRTQAAVVADLQAIRDGDPTEILYSQWRAYSGIDASETEAQQLARVTGVAAADAERALDGPDLDSMYREWAAYSVPNDEPEEAEREGAQA